MSFALKILVRLRQFYESLQIYFKTVIYTCRSSHWSIHPDQFDVHAKKFRHIFLPLPWRAPTTAKTTAHHGPKAWIISVATLHVGAPAGI
jgi:hypothetical protein